VNSLQVFINGVLQTSTDYTETSTTVVTFTTGVPLGDLVTFVVQVTTDIGTADATSISYTHAAPTISNVDAKLRESVSVKDFGAVGDGVTSDVAAMLLAIRAEISTTDTNAATITLFAAQGDIAVPVADLDSQIFSFRIDLDAAVNDVLGYQTQIMIPLGPTNQDFKLTWSNANGDIPDIVMMYRGFMTD